MTVEVEPAEPFGFAQAEHTLAAEQRYRNDGQ
jgi:hypothetical protein